MKLIAKLGGMIARVDGEIDSEFYYDQADDLVKAEFPSGSGVDSGTKIVWEKTNKNKIVLQADFHHMNDGGYYDGWAEHQIVITPDWDGFNLKVTGRNRNEVKEYLGDLFHHTLNREV